MALSTDPRGNPCTRCGACCAAFRVDFHPSELAEDEGRGVPAGLAVLLLPHLARMRGTDSSPPRCVALAGSIGEAVSCQIHEDRPSPCRDFAPYAPLGIGDDACDRARARHGLPPLRLT
ncbi:MAG: YkgJ family cysteine cluster protein [Zoogloeaceae bacterium]|nr:YkgJ family cysteine cluster protein [Zoogloeaceae bacterium]